MKLKPVDPKEMHYGMAYNKLDKKIDSDNTTFVELWRKIYRPDFRNNIPNMICEFIRIDDQEL